jgi:hypothetical protein
MTLTTTLITAWLVALSGEPSNAPECKKDADCNDYNACTKDTCKDGKCRHKSLSCDDGKSCTKDSCHPETGCSHLEQCPDCSKASATPATLWPPNHKFVNVGITGVSDPEGQATTISITGVAQDEPTDGQGDGDTCPDAQVGDSSVSLRSERSGGGDGRVYHLYFTAKDPDGHSCSGQVKVCVPHDRGGGGQCTDSGPSYDSLICGH